MGLRTYVLMMCLLMPTNLWPSSFFTTTWRDVQNAFVLKTQDNHWQLLHEKPIAHNPPLNFQGQSPLDSLSSPVIQLIFEYDPLSIEGLARLSPSLHAIARKNPEYLMARTLLQQPDVFNVPSHWLKQLHSESRPLLLAYLGIVLSRMNQSQQSQAFKNALLQTLQKHANYDQKIRKAYHQLLKNNYFGLSYEQQNHCFQQEMVRFPDEIQEAYYLLKRPLADKLKVLEAGVKQGHVRAREEYYWHYSSANPQHKILEEGVKKNHPEARKYYYDCVSRGMFFSKPEMMQKLEQGIKQGHVEAEEMYYTKVIELFFHQDIEGAKECLEKGVENNHPTACRHYFEAAYNQQLNFTPESALKVLQAHIKHPLAQSLFYRGVALRRFGLGTEEAHQIILTGVSLEHKGARSAYYEAIWQGFLYVNDDEAFKTLIQGMQLKHPEARYHYYLSLNIKPGFLDRGPIKNQMLEDVKEGHGDAIKYFKRYAGMILRQSSRFSDIYALYGQELSLLQTYPVLDPVFVDERMEDQHRMRIVAAHLIFTRRLPKSFLQTSLVPLLNFLWAFYTEVG